MSDIERYSNYKNNLVDYIKNIAKKEGLKRIKLS